MSCFEKDRHLDGMIGSMDECQTIVFCTDSARRDPELLHSNASIAIFKK